MSSNTAHAIEDIRQRLKNLAEKKTATDLSSTSQATTRTCETAESHVTQNTGFTHPREVKKSTRLPFSSSGESVNFPTKSSLPPPKMELGTPSLSQLPNTAEKKFKTVPRSISEKPRSTEKALSKKTINGKDYRIFLDLIGTGGSSKVYSAHCINDNQDVAIKYVSFRGMEKNVIQAYIAEINLLKELQGSNYVVKMYDYEETPSNLTVIMEKGEIDLAKFIRNCSSDIDEIWIKKTWSDMLKCVKVIHDKNIVHSDLKPANFLFVKARLKLIDFGIASKIQDDKTSVVKSEQMGTLNYMSPEMLGAIKEGPGMFKVPLKADVWSLGCILYLIVYGQTPFQHVSQMMKIPTILNEKYAINFPKSERVNDLLLDILKRCLERDFKKRPSVDELLQHPYLTQSYDRLAFRINDSCLNENDLNGNEEFLKLASELNQCTPRTGARKLKKLMRANSLKFDDKENS